MSIIACTVGGCHKPVYVKKHQLCQAHYNRFMAHRDMSIEPPPKFCGHCEDPITRSKKTQGPPAKYCTDKCRRLAAYERRIASGAQAAADAKARAAYQPKPITERSCADCGGPFRAKRIDARFCSTTCVTRFGRSNPDGSCAVKDCRRTSEARGLCPMHWKRKASTEGSRAAEPWDERRKANYQKRRAQKLNLPADVIRPLEVYERDEWVCGLCALPVDGSLRYPDRASPSLDHITPLSIGGHHVMENVQLAHLSCNVRKGNRVEVDVMSA